jgi:hypothetical protein
VHSENQLSFFGSKHTARIKARGFYQEFCVKLLLAWG